jgi:hypothetical protein
LDARPITDSITHYVLSIVSTDLKGSPDLKSAMRTAASLDDDSLPDDFDTVDDVSTPYTILTSQLRTAGPIALHYGLSTASSSSVGAGSGNEQQQQQPLTEQPKLFGRSRFSDLRTSDSLADTPSSLNKLNFKFASHVVFYLSATNWDTVFAKVQKSLREWMKVGSIHGKGVGNNFVLASCCAFDKARLSQFLQGLFRFLVFLFSLMMNMTEIASLFISLPSEVYPQVAFAIRRAVWRWIQIFPRDFAETLQHNRRLDNASQRLYDILISKLDEMNKVYMWPVLTALLIISNEKMRETETQFNGDSVSRQFFRNKKVRLFFLLFFKGWNFDRVRCV